MAFRPRWFLYVLPQPLPPSYAACPQGIALGTANRTRFLAKFLMRKGVWWSDSIPITRSSSFTRSFLDFCRA